MGTYCNIWLLDATEKHIESVNDTLEKLGIESPIHDGVRYGAFCTRKMLLNDVDIMNSPEGANQCPDWPRPVTVDYYVQNWPFVGQGLFNRKFRDDDDIKDIAIVTQWTWQNRHLIDTAKSRCWEEDDIINQVSEGCIRKYWPSLAEYVVEAPQFAEQAIYEYLPDV